MCDGVGDRRDYRRVWCLCPVVSHFPFQLMNIPLCEWILLFCLSAAWWHETNPLLFMLFKTEPNLRKCVYPEKQIGSDPFRDLKEGWLTSPRGRNSQLSLHSLRYGCTGERWMNSSTLLFLNSLQLSLQIPTVQVTNGTVTWVSETDD